VTDLEDRVEIVLATFVGPAKWRVSRAETTRPRPCLAYFMRVGPRSPRHRPVPVDRDWRDDECARRQWFEAVFGSDGDREALVEDVLDEADDEQTLVRGSRALSHGLDAVETSATGRNPR